MDLHTQILKLLKNYRGTDVDDLQTYCSEHVGRNIEPFNNSYKFTTDTNCGENHGGYYYDELIELSTKEIEILRRIFSTEKSMKIERCHSGGNHDCTLRHNLKEIWNSRRKKIRKGQPLVESNFFEAIVSWFDVTTRTVDVTNVQNLLKITENYATDEDLEDMKQQLRDLL